MNDSKISALTAYSNPDPVNDSIPIVDNTNSTTKKISRNNLLGITSTPVGINDIQTLTQKTLTSPTINGATLSGTLSGTYTIGGTPTFPASVVTLTGSQTLTNKILTSPTINAPTITNASITADAITGFTTSNTGTIYGVGITSGAFTNSNILPAGTVVQVVDALFTAASSGTTVIPYDDTIPQNTEGDQYMTLAITPKSTTNKLIIEATIHLSNSAVSQRLIAALFQDSTANALAVGDTTEVTGGVIDPVVVYHSMPAGTTGSTTFKIRAGANNVGTTTFNGDTATRKFGGITFSYMKITEIKV